MIPLLSFAALFILVYFAFIEVTTVTTDISKYERVLKLSGYPNNQLIQCFPDRIPVNAKNTLFRYNPAFMQGGENFDLKFETNSASIDTYNDDFSKRAKWTGKFSDCKTENNGIMLGSFGMIGYTSLPDDFVIYIFDSKPYKPSDWNHGYISVAAVSKERNEIIFHSEHW